MAQNLILPPDTIVPDHIAVVLDGNGRWARSRGLPENKGHEAGGKAVREIIDAARKIGVHTITLWGFSTENWKRPTNEVRKIMQIVRKNIEIELENAHKEGVRFVHIGRKDRLPSDLSRWINKAEEETKDYQNHVLNLAFDYGGRDEIVRAVQKIIKAGISPDKIDEKLFASYLDTADQPYPYPDLFIRTSGEQRTSGLLPWQLTYAEFYFEQDHLPDMTPEKLKAAILDFNRRRRKFGAKDGNKKFKFKPEVTAGLELKWWRLGNIPEGTKFHEYAHQHIHEQFGLSKDLSLKAAKYFVDAMLYGEKHHWKKAVASLAQFYKLVKEEVKLAFEPEIVANLRVKLWKDIHSIEKNNSVAAEESARAYYAEMYRMSIHQASKIAHLRILAKMERNLALQGKGDHHWDKAEEYLNLYYRALKDRVA